MIRSPPARRTAVCRRRRARSRRSRPAAAIDDPFSGEPIGEASGELGIVARQQRADIENRDPRAEPAMRLRHLDPDRSAADHDQMFGRLAVGENRLVRQIGDAVEARDRRDRGMRSRWR